MKKLYNYEKEKKRESKKYPSKKYQKKKEAPVQKGKGKKAKNEAWRCPICDINWEDDDGKNGQWLGCECGQWLHEQCIEYELANPHLVCPNCNCM